MEKSFYLSFSVLLSFLSAFFCLLFYFFPCVTIIYLCGTVFSAVTRVFCCCCSRVCQTDLFPVLLCSFLSLVASQKQLVLYWWGNHSNIHHEHLQCLSTMQCLKVKYTVFCKNKFSWMLYITEDKDVALHRLQINVIVLKQISPVWCVQYSTVSFCFIMCHRFWFCWLCFKVYKYRHALFLLWKPKAGLCSTIEFCCKISCLCPLTWVFVAGSGVRTMHSKHWLIPSVQQSCNKSFLYDSDKSSVLLKLL